MGLCFFSSKVKERQQKRNEEERIMSLEARAKAAEAAEKRQEMFDKSAAGKAVRLQQAALGKKHSSTTHNNPLKWQMG